MNYPTYNTRAISDIVEERSRQDAKWGEQNHPDGTGGNTVPLHGIVRGPGSREGDLHFAFGLATMAKDATDQAAKRNEVTWRDIFLEEVFEAIAESDPAALRTELIQVAAVASQWAEAIDRRPKDES